jgi:hypothetical protein
LGGIAVATSLTQRQRCAALGWGTSQDIPYCLLGVIRLDAESYESLPDALILIGILRTKRLGKSVPQFFESDDELFGRNVVCVSFLSNSLEEIGEFGRRIVRPLELIRERTPQLVQRFD